MRSESKPHSTGWGRWQQLRALGAWACHYCGRTLTADEFCRTTPYRCRGCRRNYANERSERMELGRHHIFIRSLRGRFGSARRKARARGLAWSLSLTEYERLTQEACHYCGWALPPAGVGLDRLDNAIGYDPSNVVPCCTVCNLVRSNIFTPSEMVRLGTLIGQLKVERPSLHTREPVTQTTLTGGADINVAGAYSQLQ